MSDPLERAIERGTQRRLLSENANLRAKLAQAEAREADNERVIVGLNKQLTEQFELSTKYVGISEECRAALSTARAEADAMREALKKAKQFVYVNGQGPEDQELLNCLEAAVQAHPHGEEPNE